MTTETFVIIALLVYILIKEVFFYLQLQKLVNKLMSRNYFEHEQAEAVKSPPKAPGFSVNLQDHEGLEDMRRITGF